MRFIGWKVYLYCSFINWMGGGGWGLMSGYDRMKRICPCFTPSRIALAESARETESLPWLTMLSIRFFVSSKRLYDIHITWFDCFSRISVVEVLDEDSRVEGCFKNKKVFIEELSSAQTILIASHLKCSASRHVKTAMPFCLQISV